LKIGTSTLFLETAPSPWQPLGSPENMPRLTLNYKPTANNRKP
jgi:hypothetical protein